MDANEEASVGEGGAEEGEKEAGGEEFISAGKVNDFLCCDIEDATKSGLTCAYIAKNKPDKCHRSHNEERVGERSCLVSLGIW